MDREWADFPELLCLLDWRIKAKVGECIWLYVIHLDTGPQTERWPLLFVRAKISCPTLSFSRDI